MTGPGSQPGPTPPPGQTNQSAPALASGGTAATDTVLVVLLEPAGAATCLSVVSDAARVFARPEVKVLHVRCDPAAGMLPSEEVLPEARRKALAAQGDTDAGAVHAAWLAWRDPALPSQWEQVDGVPADVVATHGQVALLVMMGLPQQHAALTARAALDAALFGPGQPVLVVPAGWTGGFGRHLAVGWRDTAATRHALQVARPWLDRAETVSVLFIGTGEPSWPDRSVLDLPAPRVSFRAIDPKGGDEGASLLAAVAESGADGLVMGAYRRSRVMEWILGGVTRHVLHEAALPLLMVH